MRKSRYEGLIQDPERLNIGVGALFNADLHKIDPGYVPREDWVVITPRIIDGVFEPSEVKSREMRQLDAVLDEMIYVARISPE